MAERYFAVTAVTTAWTASLDLIVSDFWHGYPGPRRLRRSMNDHCGTHRFFGSRRAAHG
jgi:hypothetical protein